MIPETESEARTQAAELYRELGRRGLCPASAGNVKLRTSAGMIVTPSGVAPEAVTAECLVSHESRRAPARRRGAVERMVHARADLPGLSASAMRRAYSRRSCTALACLGEESAGVSLHGGWLSAAMTCAARLTSRSARRTGAGRGGALTDRTACLLANHGMIVHAADGGQALAAALLLETLSRQYLLARSAGTPRLLTADEMREAQERFGS